MLPPIIVDISEVAQEFIMSGEEVKSMSQFILSNIADEYIRNWEHLVDQNLHSTRSEYKKAIFSEQQDDYSIIIGLTPRESQLALMLEDGASIFDIKEGYKKSSKRKIGKDGKWYLTVPFRWATSEALGESGVFANKMPAPIEKLVKVSKQPLTFNQLPGQFRQIGSNKTSGYTHKSTIYEGLFREEIGSGSKEKRGGYFSFRRVSDNSDPLSWIHPGFTALKLMEKAAQETDLMRVVDYSVQQFLDTNR